MGYRIRSGVLLRPLRIPLLVAVLIVGLLGMHVLGGHDMAMAADPPGHSEMPPIAAEPAAHAALGTP